MYVLVKFVVQQERAGQQAIVEAIALHLSRRADDVPDFQLVHEAAQARIDLGDDNGSQSDVWQTANIHSIAGRSDPVEKDFLFVQNAVEVKFASNWTGRGGMIPSHRYVRPSGQRNGSVGNQAIAREGNAVVVGKLQLSIASDCKRVAR